MRISEMATMNSAESLSLQKIAAQSGADETSSVGGEKDEAGISSFAQFLNKLEQLQEKDSDEFTQTLNEMANNVREKASSATGKDAKMLNKLADDLDSAAETGDLSVLQPKPPEEKGGFMVSSDGTYGPKNSVMMPAMQDDANGASSMQALIAGLSSKIDEALAA